MNRTYVFPAWFKTFQCKPLGCCCKHFGNISFDRNDYERLKQAVRGTDLEEHFAKGVRIIAEAVEGANPSPMPLDPNQDYAAFATRDGERCAFLKDDARCTIHDELGAGYLPSICRNFPMFAAETEEGTEITIDMICPAAREIVCHNGAPFGLTRESEPPAGRDFPHRPANYLYQVKSVHVGGSLFIPWSDYRALRQAMLDCASRPPIPIFARLGVLQAVVSEIGEFQEVDPWVRHAVQRLDQIASAKPDVEPAPPSQYAWLDRFYQYMILAASAPAVDEILRDWRTFLVFVERPQEELKDDALLRRHLVNWQDAFRRHLLASEPVIAPLLDRYLLLKLSAIGTDSGRSILQNLDRTATAISQALRYAFSFAAAMEQPVTTELFAIAIGFADFRLRSSARGIISFADFHD